MDPMSNFLSRFLRDDSGSVAIEYGLLAAFVLVLLVVALGFLGTKLSGTFAAVSSALP